MDHCLAAQNTYTLYMYVFLHLTHSPRDVSPCSTHPLPHSFNASLSLSTPHSSILTTLFDLSFCCLSSASAIWSSPIAYILFKRGSISLHLSASLFPLSHCFPHNIATLHQRSRDWCWTLVEKKKKEKKRKCTVQSG